MEYRRKKLRSDFRTRMSQFDSNVNSLILYVDEIWSCTDIDKFEQIEEKYVK